MSELVPLFLTIHILTAIVAFGPTFVFPIIARMAAAEPQHGLFALRLTDRIEQAARDPGLALRCRSAAVCWSGPRGSTWSHTHWLLLAIGLYVVAIAFAILIQVRTVDRMIELATELAAGRPGPGRRSRRRAARRAARHVRCGRRGRNPAAEMAAARSAGRAAAASS